MATHLIGYDLNSAGKNYDTLMEEIKNLGSSWWHHLESTWLINSNLTVVQIRDRLESYLGSDDELLVIEIKSGTTGAWTGFSQKGSSWLKSNLYTWPSPK